MMEIERFGTTSLLNRDDRESNGIPLVNVDCWQGEAVVGMQ